MFPSNRIRNRIILLVCLLVEGCAFTISIGGRTGFVSTLQSPLTSSVVLRYPQELLSRYERSIQRAPSLLSTLSIEDSDGSEGSDDDVEDPLPPQPSKRRRLRQIVAQRFQSLTDTLSRHRPSNNKRTTIPWAVRLAIVSASLGIGIAPPTRYLPNSFLTTPAAHASAPVMALPKAEGRDPANEALMQYERRMRIEAQNELTEMSKKAREIESTQGEKARIKFEKEFKEQQQQRAIEKQQGLQQLQRNLLDQGIDPFVDLEGQRQVMFYEKGVDLGDVPGTPFHLDKELEKSNYKRSMAFTKAYHRQVIACMVQDLKNRNLDPLEYFQSHQDRTETILNLPLLQAKALAEQYAANLELYGQIQVPKEGEINALERMKQQSNDPAVKKAAKVAAQQETARIKAETKAREAAERQQQKELQQQRKLEAKRQAELAKAQAEASAQQAATQAREAAASAAAASIDSAMESADDVASDFPSSSVATSPSSSLSPSSSKKSSIPIVPVSSFLVAVGGGGYAVKLYREKAQRDEEERQRRFQLLMGGSSGITKSSSSSSRTNGASSTTSSLLDEGIIDTNGAKESSPPAPTPAPKVEPTPSTTAATSTTPKKKQRRGLNVFARRKNEREVDLMALVSDDARAPEFAMLLSKILTFGAPGRFPSVVSLPGGMPMDTFDLETAQQLLVEARLSSHLELDESAEVFANVVNCMLIDIVDLASSSLKEGDDQTTIAAIDIVVNFMQHAASLYDSVAGNVVISPVTYGGTLSRSKLEQMYSTYAGSAMSTNLENARDDFDDRVRLLQDVFQITDKKAEGLMLKVMQKNMMEMLKSGEGLEGMQEMLAGMGGMGGLDGMAPNGMPGMDGNEPTPEQVKEMLLALKSMKDSGSFSKEDLDNIKKEFKASFGSSVDDLSHGQPLDATEQELLDLMKSILEE